MTADALPAGAPTPTDETHAQMLDVLDLLLAMFSDDHEFTEGEAKAFGAKYGFDINSRDSTENGAVLVKSALRDARMALSELAGLRSRQTRDEDGQRDTARLDWLQANAYQLSTLSEGEVGDGEWNVFPNAVDLDGDSVVPSGRGVREAIDAAMSGAPSTPQNEGSSQ